MNADQATDIAEINQLAFRYAVGLDTCDTEAFVSVFAPEAQLKVFAPGADQPSRISNGHADLAQAPGAMKDRFTRTAHLMTNHLINLDGDTATGSLLCTARHFFPNDAGGTDLVVVIRYIDRYSRLEGRWVIVDREIRFLWSETHSTLTDDQVLGVLQID